MSPQDFLQKIQLFIALWRTRRFDQLAAAGAVAGAGAFVWTLSGKTPIPLADSYREIALIVLAVFTAACTVFLVIRVSRIQDPNTGAGAQALPSSVRGPLPFTEADSDLFRKLGRDYLIDQALAFVTNDQIPVILVSGESGVGKTSLLRAGLTAPLKDRFGRNVIYWEAKPTNPFASLTATVVDALGESPGIDSCDDLFQKRPLTARPVVIIDQLEQLSPASEAHLPVYDLIVKAAHASAPHPATWIIAFRRDFVGIYEFLAERGLALPFVLVTAFTREEAEQVMATLADKAGVSFERQLLKDFTASAAVNGAVSSVDIGIGTLVLVNLAKHAKKDTITLDDYKFAGGSSGVLTAYVSDQLAVYPEAWQEAVLKPLLSLIDLAKNQRIAEGRTASALAEGSTLPPGRLAVILDSLAAPHIRILEKLETSAGAEPVFRLPHERFIQPIRTLAGSLLAKENLAQFVLDSGFSSWMRSRDPRLLLSGKDLKQVQSLVAQRASAFSADVLDYVRLSLRHEHLKLVKATAVGVLAIFLFVLISIRQQWIPQTIANLRSVPNGYVLINSFPDAGIVMTGTSGTDPNHFLLQHNVQLWRARDGKLLTQVPGSLRATCQSPEKILLSGPMGNGLSIFDIRQLATTRLNGFISEDELLPVFVGSCEYFGFVHNPNADSQANQENETLHFWETATGEPVSTPGAYSSVNIDGLYPNRDASKSILIQGRNSEPELWNLASGKLVSALSRHKGGWYYMVDYADGLVAVRENLGNGRSAVELWDLQTGALLRETTVDGFMGSLRFTSKGTLLFLKANDNTGTLLRVSDFVRSPLLAPGEQSEEGGEVVWFQSGKDIVILDYQSTVALHIQNLDMSAVSVLATPDAMNAALVLEKDGTLLQCGDSARCKAVATGVASIGQVTGSETVFARAKQDNSLALFDFAGKALGRGLSGDWGSVYAISYNTHCGDVFAWSSSADLLRYRARWAFFGRPFADVHMGCLDE
jgi:WD40 repeat protein